VTRALAALLAAERQGVLATLSASRGGWPFASIAPFAPSSAGEPLLLLSDLAEHTRNLAADGRASLLVQDSASLADPQAGARATLLGHVERVDDEARAAELQRYLARHPSAVDYVAFGDFHLYALRVTEARVIGGFADAGWLRGAALQLELATGESLPS
jgi:heme iron utilization protein